MLNIGDLVKVIVEHPSGVETTTYGHIGIISEEDKLYSGNPCYLLHTMYSAYDYWYGEDELRLITDEEAREALKAILFGGKAK